MFGHRVTHTPEGIMTNFILAAKAHATVIADPKAMLDAGELTAYSVRSNGTTRHLDLAPLGSTRRDTAEWISERLGDGASVAQVAHELHVSKPTVRRYLLALELTEEIEAGEWDQVWAEAQELPYSEPVDTEGELDSLLAAWSDMANAPVLPPTPEQAQVLMTVHL